MKLKTRYTEQQGLQELLECTKKIKHGIQALKELVETVERVRKKKLYLYAKDASGKPKYQTFEAYTLEEFGFGRSYLSKLKAGHQTVRLLESSVAPNVLAQISSDTAYELSRIPEEQRLDAVKDLSAKASDGKITSRMVKEWHEDNSQQTTHQGALHKTKNPNSVIDISDTNASLDENEQPKADDESNVIAVLSHDDTTGACVDDEVEGTRSDEQVEKDTTVVADESEKDYDADDNETDEEDEEDEIDETDDIDETDEENETDEERDYDTLNNLRRLLSDSLAERAAKDDSLAESIYNIMDNFWEQLKYYQPVEEEE